MKVISVIEDEDVIKKILKHLVLWEVKPRPLHKAIEPQKTNEYSIDYSTSQLPTSYKWPYGDPEYQRFTRLRRGLLGGPPPRIFQMGRRVQWRGITFLQTTITLSTKIWPQIYLHHL